MKETLTNMYKPQTNIFKGLLGNFTDQKLTSKWTVTVISQIIVVSRLNRLPFKRYRKKRETVYRLKITVKSIRAVSSSFVRKKEALPSKPLENIHPQTAKPPEERTSNT